MQLDLPTPPAYRGAQRWVRKLEWCRKVVNLLGHKFVAGELDIAPSHLTDALLERERKSVKGEWIEKLFELCDAALRTEYLELCAEDTHCRIVVAPQQLTDSELRAAYNSGALQWSQAGSRR